MLGTHIELDVTLVIWELREKCSYYMSAGHSREGVSALGRCQVGGLWEEGDRLDSSGDSQRIAGAGKEAHESQS